jgi:hypothetical protein
MLGIHIASAGFRSPLRENCEENCMKRIYEKVSISPRPICIPIPPLILRDESDTPISVRMKKANGEE